jgi:prolyl-tRNA synthetase
MEKDLLQAVIKVESEIHQSIESERKNAAEWLESIRVSLSQELEAQKQQLEEEFAQSLENTSNECELKAKNEIADVNQMAEHLQNLPEKFLHNVVKEFLPKILPTENR